MQIGVLGAGTWGVALARMLHKEGKKVLSSIEDELLACDGFQISVAFITMSGITPLLQTLKEMEKKKKSPEKEGEEPKRKHGGGRPKTEFTPELEAEIYRRYKQGQRAAIVARELGINDHGIYTRYRKWKAEDKEQEAI